MAEEHEVKLFLKQNIGEALKSAGKSLIETRAGLAKIGPAASTAFSMAGVAMTGLNQTLEVGKKAIETFQATIGASIEKSLEFREVGDSTLQYFKDLGRESDLVKARIGDALLPVIQGFSEAILDSTGSISEFIAENQKLIGSGLVDFLGKTADLLVSGVAMGVQVVSKAFLGLDIVVSGIKAGINAMFSGALGAIGSFLEKIQTLASAFGREGLAESIGKARASVQGLAGEFDKSSADAIADIGKTAATIEKLDATIRKVEKTAHDAIGKGVVNAQKRVQEATVGTTRSIEEQIAAMEKQKEVIAKQPVAVNEPSKRRIAAIDTRIAPDEGGDIGISDIAGGLGEAGTIIQGFTQGGPMGAAVAAIGEVLSKSEAFAEMLGKVSEIFADVAKAIDPLIEAVDPVIDAVSEVVGVVLSALSPILKTLASVLNPIVALIKPLALLFIAMNPTMLTLRLSVAALEPVMKVLSTVLTGVAEYVLSVGEAIAQVWNGIVGAIAGILKKLGGIKVFGKKPLGFIEEWGNDLQRKASISTEAFDEARKSLKDGADMTSQALVDGAETIKDTTEEITRNLTNVPGILKVALEEFNAVVPGLSRGGGGSVARSSMRNLARSPVGDALDRTGGTTINANNITVSGGASVPELARTIRNEAIRTGSQTSGSLAESDKSPANDAFHGIAMGIAWI